MNGLKTIFTFILFSIFSIYATAQQKVGHINSGNVMAQLPESKASNEQLVEFQKQLIAKGEVLSLLFDNKVAQYQKEGKGMKDAEKNEKEKALRAEQASIENLNVEIRDRLEAKRKELIKPIILKLQQAVVAVGKENKFDFILDVSTGNMLFASDSQDIAGLVKKKLGIQ